MGEVCISLIAARAAGNEYHNKLLLLTRLCKPHDTFAIADPFVGYMHTGIVSVESDTRFNVAHMQGKVGKGRGHRGDFKSVHRVKH